ncbi:MAG: YhjD/YihY/BrkB family envelope integrity protein [Nitrospirota bacterium]
MLHIKQFVQRDLWTTDLRSLHGVSRVAVQAVRLAVAVSLEFRHRLLDARAAGLVYTTLLSLVPFLAVVLSVLKAFGVHHQLEPLLAQVLEPLGPKGQEVTQRVIGVVDNLNVGVLGVIGVAIFLYTTYSLIEKIEEALNAVWQVRHGRTWTRKFTDYLSVVLVGPVLVVTALGLLASVQHQTLVQRVLQFEPLGTWVVALAKVVPFLLLALVFSFIYKFVPNTRVHLSSALVGGASAALLWGLAGMAFAKFVAGSGQYGAVYSGFAIVLLLLIWLYAAWLIVLVGAQVAFFHQHPTAYQSTLMWQHQALALRERIALMVVAALTRRFLNGQGPVRPAELARELHLAAALVDEQVEQLVKHGYLGRTTDPQGVTLIKPPASTAVTDVLNAIREVKASEALIPLNADDPVVAALRRRDQAVEQGLAGVTLQSLVGEAHDEAAATRET